MFRRVSGKKWIIQIDSIVAQHSGAKKKLDLTGAKTTCVLHRSDVEILSNGRQRIIQDEFATDQIS